MQAAIHLRAVAVAAFMPLLCVSDSFGQSGSTGGVIGKQNKDASGVSDATALHPAAPRRARPINEALVGSATFSATALNGNWRIDVTCGTDPYLWSFNIRESSSTEFSGSFSPGDGTVKGTLNGNRISMTTVHFLTRTWTGILSRTSGGLRMEGSMTGSGGCLFDAKKG